MRSHRAQISAWLRATHVSTVEQLFDALAGRDGEATAHLLVDYRRGVSLASTVLLGAKAVMLASVARHAPGDTAEERFQVTVDAFLAHALPKVEPTHKYVDAQLYWVTLRTVAPEWKGRRLGWPSKLHKGPLCDAAEPRFFDEFAGADVHADPDSYLTADAVLNWALTRGFIVEDDHRALVLRYGGEKARPVREVAAIVGVSENMLESRLRRAMTRLRAAVVADRDDLHRACIDARWVRHHAEAHSAAVETGAAA
ncbi:sigma-70 family RNA polymerase sigma factor [Mycobacterium avium]|nr:sigma-70 family RNA polymerase sigma factor [Mycobacterium avium]